MANLNTPIKSICWGCNNSKIQKALNKAKIKTIWDLFEYSANELNEEIGIDCSSIISIFL